MKKFAILFLAVTAIMFTTSCSDDDDAGTSVSIQGSWILIAESEGGVNIPLEDCELEQAVTFAGTTGSAKVLDDDTPPCTFENIPFTYSVSGNDLTLTINSVITVTSEAVVEELSATTLRFRVISDSIDGDYDPQEIIVQTYTRQ